MYKKITAVVSIVFFFSMCNFVLAWNEYDVEEEWRQAGKQVERIQKNEERDARIRYYDRHYSDSSNTGFIWWGLCATVIIVFAAAIILSAKESKEFEAQLRAAIENGFSLNDETKKCPKCAEFIKLQAVTCQYCGKKFSEVDNFAILKTKLESFKINGV